MMQLQKLIGIVLSIIGIAGHSPLLIFVGIFLIFTKYDYTSLVYGDPTSPDEGFYHLEEKGDQK